MGFVELQCYRWCAEFILSGNTGCEWCDTLVMLAYLTPYFPSDGVEF